ncbi:MAG: phosphate signaling complex protein PhoU [Candidatus Zixiibacteriota bacterium]
MTKHLLREIERLKRSILAEGAIVERAIDDSIRSLLSRDQALAKRVIDNDHLIDDMEVRIEEDCLKILALHQPVAIDLRFIVAAMKINSGLERMGDLAVNIAERASYLATQETVTLPVDFGEMAAVTKRMVRESLQSLVNSDPELALTVTDEDDIVDDFNRQMFIKVQQRMSQSPGEVKSLLHCLSASRHLERIADLATNIAEDVIYMTTGDIIRHRVEDYSLLDEPKTGKE